MTVVLLQKDGLYVSNVGDTRALLCTKDAGGGFHYEQVCVSSIEEQFVSKLKIVSWLSEGWPQPFASQDEILLYVLSGRACKEEA